jgi:hypothetical protein
LPSGLDSGPEKEIFVDCVAQSDDAVTLSAEVSDCGDARSNHPLGDPHRAQAEELIRLPFGPAPGIATAIQMEVDVQIYQPWQNCVTRHIQDDRSGRFRYRCFPTADTSYALALNEHPTTLDEQRPGALEHSSVLQQ